MASYEPIKCQFLVTASAGKALDYIACVGAVDVTVYL